MTTSRFLMQRTSPATILFLLLPRNRSLHPTWSLRRQALPWFHDFIPALSTTRVCINKRQPIHALSLCPRPYPRCSLESWASLHLYTRVGWRPDLAEFYRRLLSELKRDRGGWCAQRGRRAILLYRGDAGTSRDLALLCWESTSTTPFGIRLCCRGDRVREAKSWSRIDGSANRLVLNPARKC